jgi:hypothetical protein
MGLQLMNDNLGELIHYIRTEWFEGASDNEIEVFVDQPERPDGHLTVIVKTHSRQVEVCVDKRYNIIYKQIEDINILKFEPKSKNNAQGD